MKINYTFRQCLFIFLICCSFKAYLQTDNNINIADFGAVKDSKKDTTYIKLARRIHRQFTQVSFIKPLPIEFALGKDMLATIDNYPSVTIRNRKPFDITNCPGKRLRGMCVWGKFGIDSNF